MTDNNRSTTETKNWGSEAESTINNLFGRAQELVKDSSNHHLVIRRPNAKLLDIPVKLPILIAGIVFLLMFFFSPRLLIIALAAALYFQIQISLDPVGDRVSREVDDVEYRRVD